MKYISCIGISCYIIFVGITAYEPNISVAIMLSSLAVLWLIIIMGENDK